MRASSRRTESGSMKTTLSEVNELRAAGIIGQSAVGGAMAAMFYLEAFTTEDVDIFVIFENPPLILTLEPIYEFLRERGRGQCSFLPAESPLLMEAVIEAVTVSFEGMPIRVMTAEHLMAIALQMGRSKDFARLADFLVSGKTSEDKLAGILARHALLDKWRAFLSSLP
jgi:hypothetical protein